ncbi:Fe(3+) ABC transporter substrate-binding protein [Aquisalimonas lutea]|uniref:Fe(3+) ABC transporter substrate-binding protein n=1 Tax=Aquisalimonas lutea TaxID=1327750 RepID=UPI0025B598B1|nr:Fe(3+) ABC transporter substrate-binding protein [Aquisalimonas lutea]MDN3516981.1 Fe(3+) ABC transporter substrate-binding protein [Aquisalimonas lutea]
MAKRSTLTNVLPAAVLASLMLSPTAALADGNVNIYSARHYDTDDALYEAFTERTGIEVQVLEANSDQLIERIEREGEASPADVLITVDAGRLWRAQQAGVFQSIESDVLAERLPDRLRHPDGLWFGFSQRMRTIFYNRESFDPARVDTYEDLAEPEFEGEICIRSSSNIYNQSLLASLIDAHGEEEAQEWAQGVVDNMARQPQGGDTDQIRGVAAGECQLAVANHYYYVRLLKSDDPNDRAAARKVGMILPNQDGRGAHMNVGGAGVVEGAPNRDNAIRFLEYLASDEAQELFAKGNNEFPVVEGVKRDPVLESWGNIHVDDINVSALGRYNDEAVRIFDRVGWR